jgi:hypothetical protein
MHLKMRFEFPAEVFLPAKQLAQQLGVDFNALLIIGLSLVLEAHAKGVLRRHIKVVRSPIVMAGNRRNSGETDMPQVQDGN